MSTEDQERRRGGARDAQTRRRPTSRRRRARRRRRPSRRSRLLTVLVVLLGLGGLGVVLALDAVLVVGSLEDAEEAAVDARDRVTVGDLQGAQARIRDARSSLGDAKARTNRFLWRAAERVPLAGTTFRTLSGLVEVIDEGSGLGAAALATVAPLIDDDGQVVVQPVDGQLPVELLRVARRTAASLDPAGLRTALDELREVRGYAPSLITDGRDRVVATAENVAQTLTVVAPVLEVMPTFLGADGSRRYLLGMQNPAELRGTGGLLGFTAVLEADDGRLAISDSQAYSALDALGAEEDGELPPVSAPEDFARRYAAQNAAGFLGNVNVDPDLPTTGPVLLDLVEDRTGTRFDGLVLVDPLAVAHLLREIGPVEVAPEIAALAPELPTTIQADEFADLVMVEHYAVFAGRNQQRRDWLSEVASGAFEAIFDARWDGVPVTRAVLEAAGAGHVAIHLRDEDHQQAFVTADLAGSLMPPASAPVGDALAVTANNSAGNKMDRHVRHVITGDITLSGDPSRGELERHAELVVTVDNPVVPNTFGLYVEGSFPVSAGSRTPPSTERALARTWWSVWAPSHHTVTVETAEGPAPGTWVVHGQRVADAMLETPTMTAAELVARIVGPVPTAALGDARVYTLQLRRQPKAIADELGIRVAPPEGWRIVSATSRGGDAAVGVQGSGAVVEVDGGVARITGSITSDLTIQFALARS